MRLRTHSEKVNGAVGHDNGDLVERRSKKRRWCHNWIFLPKYPGTFLSSTTLLLATTLSFVAFVTILLSHSRKQEQQIHKYFSVIFSESEYSLESVFQQPTYYPWNMLYAASPDEQRWDFQPLYSIVRKPDPTFVGTPLYCVRNGKLYGWKRHQENARQHLYYELRIQTYEQLISRSLAMARYAVANSHPENVDARIVELITEPFPFNFEWMDLTTCHEKSFLNGIPFFAYLTFANSDPDETCMPLATPTYEQWGKYQNIITSRHWISIFQQQEQENPWDAKINKAVWRGSTTGEKWMFPNWRDLPRVKLVQIAAEHSHLIDAGLTNFNNRNDTEIKEIMDLGLAGQRIEMHDYQKYKSIIDIDGNSWSSRFADLLCMNSVVIKVQPRWIDYFYPELQPWVHYVPVHANLSNLVEIVTMVTSNDNTIQNNMRQIIQNANDWCRSKMTATQLSIDMLWLLISYVDMLKKENKRSHEFSKWKKDRWRAKNWIEIPFHHSSFSSNNTRSQST